MTPNKMMGGQIPGDEKVPVPARDWSAMRLALWRSRVAWEIAAHEAEEILERCKHVQGCPSLEDETAPCPGPHISFDGTTQVLGPTCEDRETRMSALVVLNAARQFAPVVARRPAEAPYFAPSREYFSDVLATLAATQVENTMLREALLAAGVTPPSPPPNPNDEQKLPARAPVRFQLEEETTAQ